MSIAKKIIFPAIGLFAISALAISSVLFFNPVSSSEAARNNQPDTEWMYSTQNNYHLAPGDIYKVENGTLYILIVEDDHMTQVHYDKDYHADILSTENP